MQSPVLVETRNGAVQTIVSSLSSKTIETVSVVFQGILSLLSLAQTYTRVRFGTGGVIVDGSPIMHATYASSTSVGNGSMKRSITMPRYIPSLLSDGRYTDQSIASPMGYASAGTAIDSNWTLLPYNQGVDRIVVPCDGFYEITYHAIIGSYTDSIIKPAMLLFVNTRCVSMDLSSFTVTPYTSPTSTQNRTAIRAMSLGRVHLMQLKQGDEIRTSLMCNNPLGASAVIDEYHVYVYRTYMEYTQPTFE